MNDLFNAFKEHEEERRENVVGVSIPIYDGDIDTAYADASKVMQKFKEFFASLTDMTYIREMNVKFCKEFINGTDNKPMLRVAARWFGPEYTVPLLDDVINTYVKRQKIGDPPIVEEDEYL